MTDEKRGQGSIRVQKPLEITYSANCPPIEARIEDISETGFFLDNTNALNVDSEIDFALELPTEEGTQRIEGRGKVIWIQPMVGAGIQFVDLSQEARETIRFFVASVYFGHAD